jgi:hypothetical protein
MMENNMRNPFQVVSIAQTKPSFVANSYPCIDPSQIVHEAITFCQIFTT